MSDAKQAASPAGDDHDDIRLAVQGDEVAFSRIVDRHQSWVARHMWRFTRDPVFLRELVQDVFVEVFFSLSGYRFRGSFPGWIRTIATRVGYRFWKQLSRNRSHDSLDDVAESRFVLPEHPGPDEAADILFQVLERLPTDDRVILTLHYFDEMEMKEIAKHLGWTVTYVKVRAHRARKKLRTWIEKDMEASA